MNNDDVNYQITFYSDWHCSSGQSAGFGVDLTVIRDRYGLPFIPGRTLKGLLRDAAENFMELSGADNYDSWEKFIKDIFGKGGEKTGGSATKCYFSNAELPDDIKSYLGANDEEKDFLFRTISSTAINERGVAKEHSLRVMETVVPLTLKATIHNFPESGGDHAKLTQCMQWIKRLGLNRNRGLGRCSWQIQPEQQARGEAA